MNAIAIYPVTYSQEQTAIDTIRVLVFQQEQGIDPDLEFDGLDESAIHLLAYLNDTPVGTLRIRQLDQQTVKLERLAVLSTERRQGIGKQLMLSALELMVRNNQIEQVIINAQEYLTEFYQKLGFKTIGARFLEAGIPHIKMIKQLK